LAGFIDEHGLAAELKAEFDQELRDAELEELGPH
jgi:hypothetical protein